MKVHMIIHELTRTGVPMAALNLIKELKQDITLVVIGENKNFAAAGAVFLGVKRRNGLLGKVRYLTESIIQLRRYLRNNGVENLFVWSKEFAAISVLVKPRYTKLLAVNASDMKATISEKKFSKLVGFIYRILLRNVDMIAQSKGLADGMREFGIKKITVIPPSINRKFFKENTTNPKKQMIWIGSFNENKRPEIAIQISKDIGIPLHMLGDNHPKKSHNLVAFHGNKEDIMPYLKDAGVILLTSKNEGFGMVLAEAIAQGVPAVSFDTLGSRDIITSENGYIVRDINEMKRAIELVFKRKWNKNKLRNTMLKFHPDKTTKQYKAIMNRVFS